MKSLLRTSTLFSWLILVLGLVHDGATLTPLIQGGLTPLHPAIRLAVLYMSFTTGTSLVVLGMVLLLLVRPEPLSAEPVRKAVMLTALFLFAIGISGVCFMTDNPFAWIALLLTTVECIAVTRIVSLSRKAMM